ncbi:MAG: MarR family winged helix-turn-helix transcriptional regulator [Solirubrobacteraceae bacterium]|nr:MarR family winged helix-turn-helix transcriptional regulator [Solirubrobacteraceae bacterium]
MSPKVLPLDKPRRPSEDQLQAISIAMAVNAEFLKIRRTIKAPAVAAFLQVVANEGMDVGQLARKMGCTACTMSKILTDLGETNRRDKDGLGLVEVRPDLLHRSRHLSFLTPRGAALSRKIAKITEEGRRGFSWAQDGSVSKETQEGL